MNWWRSRRPQDQALEPEAHHNPEGETPAVAQDPILLLQRTIGNRAVQKMLPRSEGEPIAPAERQELESAFGQDLSEVRIHRDEDAAELATDAGANAFTAGRDIYFAPGAYGSATLAHEVSHVIQQSQAPSLLPGEDAFLEHQADAASSSFMAGQAPDVSRAAAAPPLQRQAAPGTQPAPASQPAPTGQPAPMKLMPSDSITLDAFDIDKSMLTGTHKQKLDEFAKRLKATLDSSPSSIITIVGFADSPGTEPHNLVVGQQRADAVRNYLVAKGISGSQLHAVSLGEGSPAVVSKGYESKNRRVEINVIERTMVWPSLMPPAAAPKTPAPVPPAPVPVPSAPTPVPAPAVEKPKAIDLTFHPKEHESTPGEDLQDRMRLVDKAVKEAQEAEKSNHGTSAADVAGRVLRNAAKKMGLPKWLQDRAESLGKDLPSKGAQAAVDQLSGDRNLDAGAQNALKALVDALMRTKVK